MSRGLGQTQRRLLAALQAEPTRLWWIKELAAAAFPSEEIDRSLLTNVRRALGALPVRRCKVGPGVMSGKAGWRYRIQYNG